MDANERQPGETLDQPQRIVGAEELGLAFERSVSAHPPMLPDGTSFTARRSAIAAMLVADPAPVEREQLKQDIVALFREATTAAAAYGAFKDSVKALAELWKTGGVGPVSVPSGTAPRTDTAPVSVSTRTDHLGASSFVEKGWSLLSLGDPAGAEVALRRALQLAPVHSEADALLGWAQMAQAHYEEALLTFLRVLRRAPDSALAHASVGYVCLRRGQYDDAVEHLMHAVRLDNDRRAGLYAHLYLGMVYGARAMYDDAELYFRKALDLGPNLLQAWYELGKSRWAAGNPVGAVDAWRHGAVANKFNPWGKRCAAMIARAEESVAESHDT